MKIGYSMWGFLTAGVLDTPDGSRAYRRPLIDRLNDAGYQVVLLQANRDLDEAGVDLRGAYCFDAGLPELSAVIFEWRWPLPGRNTTACGSEGHTCDLHRQQGLIEHYTLGRSTPTLVWDLDRQLPADDPLRGHPAVTVAEYALLPNPGAVTVTCPVPDEAIDDSEPGDLARRARPLDLVYVGNQYGRDDAFTTFFAPAAAHLAHRVAGKWPRTEAWPHVTFTGRAPFDEVATIHAAALATVLLLPERYRAAGHQTSRLFEAVTQGCLPLTPADTACADAFAPEVLHVHDGADVLTKTRWLRRLSGSSEHRDLIATCLTYLEPYRLSRQAAMLLHALYQLTADRPPLCDSDSERTRA
ncbi:hypothetical protein AB0M36_01380 [Actinoplanes sp. NPDC051346]|uniref:glycosyltransferase family protein n=1 Tax=Actinoplanes sp. NPDC051346 TaxID=3155048 RepID=UPI0034205021